MIDIVIDASAALSWIIDSQQTLAAIQFLEQSTDKRFLAPFVFAWETQNVLLHLLHAKKLTDNEFDVARRSLDALEINLGPPVSVDSVRPLAMRERLSLFDAAYLSSAIAGGSALASRDANLLRAAQRCGLKIWNLQ